MESSRRADFKTVIGFQIWSRFDIEKGQKPLSQSKGGVLYYIEILMTNFWLQIIQWNLVFIFLLLPLKCIKKGNSRTLLLILHWWILNKKSVTFASDCASSTNFLPTKFWGKFRPKNQFWVNFECKIVLKMTWLGEIGKKNS